MRNGIGMKSLFNQIPSFFHFSKLVLILTLSATGCSKLVSHRPQDYDSNLLGHSRSRSNEAVRSENRRPTEVPNPYSAVPSQEAMRTRYDQMVPGAIKVPPRQPPRLEPISELQFPGDSTATVVQVSDQQIPGDSNQVRHSFQSELPNRANKNTQSVGNNTVVSIADGSAGQAIRVNRGNHSTQIEQPLSRPSQTKLASAATKPKTLLLRTTNDLERATAAVNPPSQSIETSIPDHESIQTALMAQSSRRGVKQAPGETDDQPTQAIESPPMEDATDGKSAPKSNLISETISMGERLMLLALPRPVSNQSAQLTSNRDAVATEQKSKLDSTDLKAAGIVVDREAFDFSTEGSEHSDRPLNQRLESSKIPSSESLASEPQAESANRIQSETIAAFSSSSGTSGSPSRPASSADPQNRLDFLPTSPKSPTGFTLEAIPRDKSDPIVKAKPTPTNTNPSNDEQYFSPDRFIPNGDVPRLQQTPIEMYRQNEGRPEDSPENGNWKWGMPAQWFPAVKELLDKTSSIINRLPSSPSQNQLRIDAEIAQVSLWEPEVDLGKQSGLTRLPKNPTASLCLTNEQFCSEIRGFRKLTPIANRQFKSGQSVLIYCEVQNYHSQLTPSENGHLHVTRLTSSCSILDKAGNVVDQYHFPEIKDESPERREHFFVYFPIRFRSLAPAEYSLVIEIEEGSIGFAGSTDSNPHVSLPQQPHRQDRRARLETDLTFTIIE